MAKGPPVFDIWICQGRLCQSAGAGDLMAEARRVLAQNPDWSGRVRLLRGGCYGQCEDAANVVVRRYAKSTRLPKTDTDRLSLTRRKNETLYKRVDKLEIVAILRAHLSDDKEMHKCATD